MRSVMTPHRHLGSSSRTTFKVVRPVLVLVSMLMMMIVSQAHANVYPNSFISPNSAAEEPGDPVGGENSLKTTATFLEGVSRIINEEEKDEVSIDETPVYISNRVERSAEPVLTRTTGDDNLLIFKNVEESLDSNDVELSGRIGHFIQPSRTDKDLYFGGLHSTSIQHQYSGEGQGALQGRSLREPLEIAPTATTTAFATPSLPNPGKPRQANPDIQDIITGIVKLLNGNVNVQANTAPVMGRPLRPLSTRINNRGPPRITDVPALPPDFDVPAPPLPPPPMTNMSPPMTTRPPTPYPFDLPPANMSPKRPYGGTIPISESKRPGFYRPVTIPPWNRRRPTKRPLNPNVPAYKPMPPMSNSDMVSLTSEKPTEDILTLDLGGHIENTAQGEAYGEELEGGTKDEEFDLPESKNDTELSAHVMLQSSVEDSLDQETADFEKNKEKNPKPDKTTKVTLVTPTMKTDHPILETPISLITDTIAPTNASKELITSTQINASSSSADLTEAFTSKTSQLESSIAEVSIKSEHSESASTVRTEQLPSRSEVGSTEDRPTAVPSLERENATGIATAPHQQHYRPRPGIVLDDTEYKPGRQPIITRPPISALGDIFDITVSAIQGPGGEASVGQGKPYVIPVDIENINSHSDVLTSPVGDEGFVSIDGKRTYLNLFGDNPDPTSIPSGIIKPSVPSKNQVVQGTSYVEQNDKPVKPNYGSIKPAQRRPGFGGRPRPSHPPVRIDTCIVGDDSTCDASQHEICRTESGVSACHCRPGTARRKHRDPCRKIVSVLLSLRVDRIYERRVVWAKELLEKSSESYEQLAYEAERAIESAMSMTPFSDEYLGSQVNNIYQGDRSQGQAGVFVNITLQLEENADTARPSVKGDIQKHLLGVIQRRSNNVGNSALWVDSPPGSVSSLQDLDECSSPELHDCHSEADCINVFGSFKCECKSGLRDPWSDNKHRAGRFCERCPAAHCSNRGECKYMNGQESCTCTGNYYGAQCELDGEVLGVAIGASVAAIIIIGLTLVCLVMWSRKWSREQKAAVGSPVFGYMATASNTVKTPVVGAPPYQLTLEDRVRWAQIADVMAQANHYAPEPGLAPTRPSSALFGYPTLQMNSTMQRHPGSIYGGTGTLPPVPLPRLNLQAQLASKASSMQGMRPLDNSSSSEEEDKVDLLGRNFHVPRPKSRSNASIANQSGIYYDVDYEQNEMYKPSGIPMKVLTGLGGSSKGDDDFWYFEDFRERKRGATSPTTSL
ncbi:uncharacterized protein LOC126736402 [Anthonomus grandis grandis]|uniref:uncharacterized protein LOC126736402 n=1 Tax=Anthonomus grandis grandis TaxID=2921223 RepID=UPI002165F220|nr:uncharacterized protein LOC126736402 [Anthonomus grandis grandis]